MFAGDREQCWKTMDNEQKQWIKEGKRYKNLYWKRHEQGRKRYPEEIRNIAKDEIRKGNTAKSGYGKLKINDEWVWDKEKGTLIPKSEARASKN